MSIKKKEITVPSKIHWIGSPIADPGIGSIA